MEALRSGMGDPTCANCTAYPPSGATSGEQKDRLKKQKHLKCRRLKTSFTALLPPQFFEGLKDVVIMLATLKSTGATIE